MDEGLLLLNVRRNGRRVQAARRFQRATRETMELAVAVSGVTMREWKSSHADA
jgi:hypothetical protein